MVYVFVTEYTSYSSQNLNVSCCIMIFGEQCLSLTTHSGQSTVADDAAKKTIISLS
jgi:hypothetical protein